ncbi:hypothetical protein AC629_32290 [Bradyrhizobium sp. NAS80.1]|nr:hypothetical protein AC629_32290 [Bradyrhizobium sp. NAS80.1]
MIDKLKAATCSVCQHRQPTQAMNVRLLRSNMHCCLVLNKWIWIGVAERQSVIGGDPREIQKGVPEKERIETCCAFGMTQQSG